MQCPACHTEARRFGKDRDGNQRYQCMPCRKTFAERPARLLGTMRLDMDKALAVLKLLVEGVSVRASMRISGVNRSTILDLLALMGERCEQLLDGRVSSLPVVDVQCDEIWGYVGMKEKTRLKKYPDEAEIGDAYCYIGMERESKLILAWHLGRRSKEDTQEFADKLALATSGRFQVTTDGYGPYRKAIPASMPDADFAQLVNHNRVHRPQEWNAVVLVVFDFTQVDQADPDWASVFAYPHLLVQRQLLFGSTTITESTQALGRRTFFFATNALSHG